MGYDLVILTTACTRSGLHNISLNSISKFLEGYKCKWIITIDEIGEESYEFTSKNFERLLSSKDIDLEIYPSKRKAGRISWFKSVKFIINKGYEFKPKIGYFWLEDDWERVNNILLRDLISKFDFSNNSFFSLANRYKELNFNPSIWSYNLYSYYMYHKINKEIMPDNGGNAERACVYNKDKPESCSGINMGGSKIFQDIGRNWAKKNISGKRIFNF